ncbi:Cupredoxin [Byssothecium circinans]|uniref:Cupredoxin n=1 Tax=Byssothecium circinans TaxID=147558 RepID=A0A6A5U029_9PLEO|nr:Cupredoxin [Byssothecium circinans]
MSLLCSLQFKATSLLLLSIFTFFSGVSGQSGFAPDCIAAEKDDFFPPRCQSGETDPLTGIACSSYGYDCIWTVKENTVGTHHRIEVNNAWPPPSIQVAEGQRIRIALVNKLNTEDVTLHFHGLLQESGSVLSDGPQHISQAGVAVGKSYVYDFVASKAGTYWIHSHSPGQYPKGLRSPLIITKATDQNADKWNYDPASENFDKVVALSDHWDDFWDIEKKYDAGLCGGNGLEIPPETQLFNDKPAPKSGSNPEQKVWLQPNNRYRLRFINMSAFARYYIWINDIDMEVIEIDGVMLKPSTSKGIELASGQRVSVVVKIDSNTSTKRIMAISDRRIHTGQDPENKNPPTLARYCKLWPTSSYSKMQYTWGWLVNGAPGNDPHTYGEPTQTELDSYATGTRKWLDVWDEGANINPFYKWRPKLPFTDQNRIPVDKTRQCGNSLCNCNDHDSCHWNPSFAWKFDELAFEPYTPLAAMAPTTYTSAHVHEITLNDDNGYGVMGLGNPKNPRFVPPDAQPSDIPKPVDVNVDYDYPLLTSLLRALWFPAYDFSKYEDPVWYSYNQSYAPQTIIMKKDEVHWFAFRTLRGDHPVHMHGHEFQLISKMPVETTPNPEARVKRFDEYRNNYATIALEYKTNPLRRDTIMVEKGTTVIVAVKANNPGVWALHCHNDFHAFTGMFMQLIEDPANLRDKLGRLDWEEGTGGTWNFRLKMLDWATKPAVSKLLYQNVKKAFTYWGYTGLDVMCGSQVCGFAEDEVTEGS